LHQDDVKLLKQEAEILKSLHHENIVEFKHIREVGGRIFLAMELMGGGQLTELIEDRKQSGQQFTDEETSTIMRCIIQSVAYIHQKGIVHRDLKPGKFICCIKFRQHPDW
jgi:calcium/calmodulin-dependent protein kinase I